MCVRFPPLKSHQMQLWKMLAYAAISPSTEYSECLDCRRCIVKVNSALQNESLCLYNSKEDKFSIRIWKCQSNVMDSWSNIICFVRGYGQSIVY
jgi:hypothetical protein